MFLCSPIDVVLFFHSERSQCLDLFALFKLLRPSVPAIVITSCGSEDLAVQAFRSGAVDYFKKPLDIEVLELVIRALLEIRKMTERKENL